MVKNFNFVQQILMYLQCDPGLSWFNQTNTCKFFLQFWKKSSSNFLSSEPNGQAYRVCQKSLCELYVYNCVYSVNCQWCPGRSTPCFVSVDPHPFYCSKKGVDRLKQKRVWIDSRCHWQIMLYITYLSLNVKFEI